MINIFKKRYPFIMIVLIWFAFAYPYIIFRKVPIASDYLVTFFPPWSAYGQFAMPVKNAAMPDVLGQIFPWKHFTIQTFLSGQIPFWNPNSFAGTPHVANYQSAVFSPFNILFFVLPFIDAWSLLVILQPLLAAIFLFLYERSIHVSKKGSLVGAISFMFCGFITTWMGYATLGYALLFLPLSLYAIESYFQSTKIRFLMLLGLSIPLTCFSGHFQISLYVLLTVVIYVVYKILVTKKNTLGLQIVIAVICGIFLSLPQILPSLEFYSQSLRSNIFQSIEVIPWGYVPTLFAPDFFGNPVTRNDWFGHYAEWNMYIGVISLILGLYAFRSIKKSFVLFFSTVAGMAVLLAFQTPLNTLLVNLHIPVLATSAASRIVSIYSVCLAILAGIGFDQLFEDIQKRRLKPQLIYFLIFGLFFIFLWIIVIGKLFLPLERIVSARQNLILPTAFFIGFCGIVCIGMFLHKNRKVLLALQLLLIGVIAFDMLRFASKWQVFESRSLVFPNVPVLQFLKTLKGPDRAFGNYGSELAVYYNLPSLEGYDPLYPKRYGEFIASLSNGQLTESARSVVSVSKNGKYTPPALNLLGVKYLIQKVSDDGKVWTLPYWDYPKDQFSLVFSDGIYKVLQNNAAFPRAFLASDYIVQTNDQKIIDTMFGKSTDLRHTVILEKDPHIRLSGKGSADIIYYTPNTITIKTNSSGNSLLFLSDTYYPGWKAFVDGKEKEILRADYTFRSVVVPPGKHTVVFSYQPQSFVWGVLGAGIGVLGLFGLWAFATRRS